MMAEYHSYDDAPVEVVEIKKETKSSTRTIVIIAVAAGVVLLIGAVVAGIALSALWKNRSQSSCVSVGSSSGTDSCGPDQQGGSANGSDNTTPTANANVTLGKMSYYTPSSWKEEMYPGTDQSGKVDMHSNVITNSSGAGLIGAYHNATPDTKPVNGLERQKQKTDNAYTVMSGLSLDRMITARYTYGESYLACADSFVYTEALKKVADSKTGKYGIEYSYSCNAENGLELTGFHGSYYDTGDTLHSFDIVGVKTSWDKHLDDVSQIRNSVTLK